MNKRFSIPFSFGKIPNLLKRNSEYDFLYSSQLKQNAVIYHDNVAHTTVVITKSTSKDLSLAMIAGLDDRVINSREGLENCLGVKLVEDKSYLGSKE